MKIIVKTVICAALLMSCAPSVVQRFSATLPQSPSVDGGTFTSGGGLTVAAAVRNIDGATGVCGVWAQSTRQSALTTNKAPIVLGNGVIFLGQERLAQNLLFMREVAPMSDYGRQQAGCVRIDRPWQAGDADRAVTIRIPRQIVANEAGDAEPGPIVEFIQTGPGAS